MSKPTREEYQKALEVNKVLSTSIEYDEKRLAKCIDELCGLRIRIVENQQIIRQNQRDIIDVYEMYEKI